METQIAPGQQFSETSSDPIPLGKSFSFHSTNRKEGKTSASYSLVVGGATGRGGGTPRSGGHSDALTPHAVELIPTLGARFSRGGPVQDPVLTRGTGCT